MNAKARGALAAVRAPPVEVGETGETAEAPGAMDDSRRALPLEIFQTGEFEPFYNQQLDVLDMEYPILPMSIFGAVVMSHDANDANRSSDRDWFIYKVRAAPIHPGKKNVRTKVFETSPDALSSSLTSRWGGWPA